jgi:hypothetical protein
MTRNYDIGLQDVAAMPPGTEKAIQLAVYGLTIDGGHHKQWFLEQALVALGVSLDDLREQLRKIDCDWEPGIAP